jgi:cobalt/nickel transport protein
MATNTPAPAKKLNGWAVTGGILAIILLVALPLLIAPSSNFGGADGAAAEAVTVIAPDYDSTWITNWWTPPGSETESMLFALQAAAGGILIGYFFGYFYGRKKGREQDTPTSRR